MPGALKASMNLKHILTTKQFLNQSLITEIFKHADRFAAADQKKKVPKALKDKILACVFYEPSTRTRFSFESAMLKLGGQVITTESAGHFSSAIKGETLEDSIKIISSYADAIVLRHPEPGAAQRAATVSTVPVINAGDGTGEHPTQALLDIYTIYKECGRTKNLHIALVGDLLHGRTIHSLIYLLAVSGKVRLSLISPPTLQLPSMYKTFLKKHKIPYVETGKLAAVLPTVDVLYMTRVQKERFSSPKAYKQVKDSFILNRQSLHQMKKSAMIMHPLPRVNEIEQAVDLDSRAAYFRQAQHGLHIRMALLHLLLKK